MSREQLHVAQAAARAMDVAGGDGDEAAPAGMRRAAFEAEFLEQATNQLTTLSSPSSAPPRYGADDRARTVALPQRAFNARRRSGCMGIRRPPRFLAMMSRTLIVSETRPCASRTIDQSRPAISQARRPAFDREQDHRAVAAREGGTRDVPQHALQHRRRDHFGLFAGRDSSSNGLVGVERSRGKVGWRASRFEAARLVAASKSCVTTQWPVDIQLVSMVIDHFERVEQKSDAYSLVRMLFAYNSTRATS